MTVAEMIEHLKTFPESMEIRIGIVQPGKHVSCSWEMSEAMVYECEDEKHGRVVMIEGE